MANTHINDDYIHCSSRTCESEFGLNFFPPNWKKIKRLVTKIKGTVKAKMLSQSMPKLKRNNESCISEVIWKKILSTIVGEIEWKLISRFSGKVSLKIVKVLLE